MKFIIIMWGQVEEVTVLPKVLNYTEVLMEKRLKSLLGLQKANKKYWKIINFRKSRKL